MKKILTVLLVLVLIVLCILGFFAFESKKDSKTNQETISQTDLFDVSGDDIAIIYDFSLQSSKGIFKNDRAYLPLSWIRDYINDRYYWDESIQSIIYTLPDDIEYFRLPDESPDNPRYFLQNGEVYLSLDFVLSRSSIYCSQFLEEQAKRLYINDTRDTYETAEISKKTALRTGESVMQRVVTELNEGDPVRIIKDGDNGWSRILTDSGLPGYVEGKYLENRTSTEPVIAYSAPVYSHLLMDEEIIMVWHQLENQISNKNVSYLLEKTDGINVISPTWFSVEDNDGNISSIASHDYVEYVHGKGIKVWALADNFKPYVNSTELLSSHNSRERLIDQLVSHALEYDIDGINIDFENLEEKCGDHFVEFIRELSVSCRREGLVLSVDNPNMQAFNAFYGRHAQAECADYVINMGYDEHFSGGAAGSVASLPFEEEGLSNCLTQVPANQLISGIPFYTRIWTIDGAKVSSKAVGIETAREWITDNDVTVSWDEALGQNYGQAGNKHLWMEDEESLKAKVSLGRNCNVAGFAAWRLGMEAPDIWNIFKKQ